MTLSGVARGLSGVVARSLWRMRIHPDLTPMSIQRPWTHTREGCGLQDGTWMVRGGKTKGRHVI